MRHFLITATLATASLTAQRTWIVDHRGFGDFLNLQPAIDAAAPDDRVIVQQGVYSESVTVSTGVIVHGDGTVILDGPLTVQDLPAGQSFRLHEFHIIHQGSEPSLTIRRCQGPVFLERVRTNEPSPTRPSARQIGVLVERSAQVLTTNSRFVGTPAIAVGRSDLAISDCSVRGLDADGARESSPAIIGLDANVSFCLGDIDGGAGSGSLAPSPAALLSGSSARLAGDATTALRGGTRVANGGPEAAILAFGGSVTHAPAVQLLGGIDGRGTRVRSTALPGLVTSGAPPMVFIRFRTISAAQAPTVVIMSLPSPRRASLFGDLWVDIGFNVVVGSGTADQAGQFRGFFPIGSNHPIGRALTLQAVTVGASILTSNPVGIVLH